MAYSKERPQEARNRRRRWRRKKKRRRRYPKTESSYNHTTFQK
jgi:hypothetical protein